MWESCGWVVGLDQRSRRRITSWHLHQCHQHQGAGQAVCHIFCCSSLAICSSDHANRMPGRGHRANSQSRRRREPTNVITRLYATPDHAYRSGFERSANIGAACSCHPTGTKHRRSTRVPSHPVWPRPVTRLSGLIQCALAGSLPIGRLS